MAGEDPAGGSAGLAELIEEHGEYILFDLQTYCGLSLVAAMRDGSGYSPRQILILIKNLPLGSATVAAMRGGDDFRGWDMDRYLSAQLIDAVRENTYAFISANSKRAPKAPEPTYRPEKVKAKKANLFSVMAGQRLDAARKARAQQRGA